MPKTDAGKRANAKWDAENRTIIACKARKDKAEVFKNLCRENGTTANAVFTTAMDRFMREHGVDPDQFSRKKD